MSGTRPFPILGASLVIALFLPTLLRPPGVSVTPDGGTATAPSNSSGLTVQFNVKNFSGQQQDFGLDCYRSGAVSSCSVWPAVLPLDPGEDEDVDVTYSTGDPGSGVVGLEASDIDTDYGYYSVTVQSPPPAKYPPVLSTAIHNGSYRDVSKCVHGCFDAMVAHTTPAYVSMDVERAVTLVYSSALAKPVGLVRVKATDNSEVAPDKMSIRLKRNGQWVSFIPNDSTEHFFEADSGSNYLAAAFDASDDSTGAYDDTVYVTSHWPGDTTETSSAPVRVLIVNEINSEFGAGWTLAGLQRVHFAPDSAIAITEGDGSIAHFPLDSCVGGPNAHCTYDSPAGDFSDLMYWAAYPYDPAYVRTYPDGTKLVFDATGLLTEAKDRLGNATSYSYSSGRLSSIVGPASDTIAFYYGGDGKLDSIQDPGGRTTTVTINGSGDLTAIVDPDGVTALTATYTDHQMQTRTDRRGGEWGFGYDFAGKLAADTLPTITADGGSVRPVVTFTSPEVYMLADSSEGTSSNPAPRRDEGGAAASVTNPRGNETEYVLQRLWAPDSIIEPLGRVTIFTRNSHGQVVKAITAVGDTLSYTWSGPNLTQVKDEHTGRTVNYQYETTYNQVTHVDGDALEAWYYWSSGKLDSLRAGTAGSPVTKFAYDARGRVDTVTDAANHLTTYYYASSGLQNTDSVITAGYRRTAYTYDSYGRVTAVTDPRGFVTSTQYDELNRITRTVGPGGPLSDTTLFAYDSLFLRRVTDAIGQEYEFTTNALGWVEKQKDPLGRGDSLTYDVNGNVRTWTNRNGQTVSFTYDELDRLVSQMGVGDTTTFEYDSAGLFVAATRLGGIVDDTVVDTLWVDVSGRPVKETTWRSGTDSTYVLQSYYTINDQRDTLAMTAPWSRSIGYRYDDFMQLDTLIDIDGGKTRVSYNGERLPSSMTLPSGLARTLTYASTHQSAKLRYSDSDVNAQLGLGFAFDSVMLVKERHNPAGDTLNTYIYDQLGRLTYFSKYYNESPDCEDDPDEGEICAEGDLPLLARRIYGYDKVGNRDTVQVYDGEDWTYFSAQIDTANRMTEFGEFKMEYDSTGNLTRKYMADSTEFNQRLSWNSLGQLEMVETNGDTVWFGYDGFGRRVTKVTESDTTRYVWDGDDLFMELDGSGNVVAEYTYYPGIDQPHSVRRGDSVYYYATDIPGNVIGLIDEADSVVNRYEYWPFGEQLSATEGVTNNLQFAAREVDETGFTYMRSRYYDCDVGRFISEDPIGLASGINLYTYVGNSPTNFRDPSGLYMVYTCHMACAGFYWYGEWIGSCEWNCGWEEISEGGSGGGPPGSGGVHTPGPGERGGGAAAGSGGDGDGTGRERFLSTDGCYEQNKFSSLFSGTARDVVEAIEVGAAVIVAGDIAATAAKVAGTGVGKAPPGASGVSWVIRNAGKAVGRPQWRVAGKVIGGVASWIGWSTAAFTGAYNTTIWIQCKLGAIQ